MNIVDMKRFEEKLREAERNLGITADNGIPIIYERSSDTAGKILASLIVVGLLLSLLTRTRSIRPPISMDMFVC
jgi:spastic paraplegia protein 7